QFLDKETKARFWFVSLHLTPDPRSTNYDALRAKQLTTVLKKIDALNSEKLPVIITGDLNSWHTRATGNKAQDVLLDADFVDTFSTPHTVNEDYSTLNNWAPTMRQYPQGFGVRLDYVLVRGAVGVTRWENVMSVKDSARPSDHNLVVSEILLPTP
ncbi:MAG: endonuclease/exonuclease/phosphatase family protein, partial [Actinomycetota bacterium]|nr:endonuclease/exonuclease/phosphatase family protein [Actinomycetota bacterium]